MMFKELERAALAMFAAREAGPRGSLEQMRAIAICLRNRHREGWHDGDWIRILERADEHPTHLAGEPVKLDPDSRPFQRLVREIDEIYFSDQAKDIAAPENMDETLSNCVFWAFNDRPYSAWFIENVLHAPDQHPMRTQMGMMMFFE